MKNTLIDLNNHLFAELERLGDESLKGDKLETEIKRATSVSQVATQIISNAALALRAEELKDKALSNRFKVPEIIETPLLEKK